MPLSSNPEAREKQLANLRSTAATKHGAYRKQVIQQRARELQAEYASSVPHATEAEVENQCTRWAMVEHLRDHVFDRGVIRNRRAGTVFPAAVQLEKTMAAWERQHAALLERERSAGEQPPSYDAVIAELTEGDGDG